jgi:hypothetical protein|tara:strand:- start:457 stop:699 length:243 start_codon:yes stop_codon:yes gene_type:complete
MNVTTDFLYFFFIFFSYIHYTLILLLLILFFVYVPLLTAPFVRLWGHAKKVSEILGVTEIKVSISHAGTMALAQALCSRS